MTWAKLDDRFHTHPKVLRAFARDRGSLALWVLTLSWSADHETDGLVTSEAVRRFFPEKRSRERAVRTLIEAGLWVRSGPGEYRIHDFLDYNPARERTERRRRIDARKKALARNVSLRGQIQERDGDRCRYCGREVNWHDRRGPAGATYDHVDPDGENMLENVVVACRSCNSVKWDTPLAESGLTLLAPRSKSGSRSERDGTGVGGLR